MRTTPQTRMQASAITHAPSPRTSWALIRSVAHSEGISALWRGTGWGLCMHIPLIGIYLPLYDMTHTHITTIDSPLATAFAPLVAGVASRSTAVLATAPLDFVRTRLQTGGTLASLGSLVTRSPRVLWTGVQASLLKDLPYAALYWSCLEPCRQALLGDEMVSFYTTEHHSPLQLAAVNAAAAAVSASVAAAVTQPADVVKTVAQHTAGSKGLTSGLWDAAVTVYTRRGWKGLFAGLGPRTARCAATYGVVMASYEVLKLQARTETT